MLKTEGEQFHIKARPGEVGRYCLLPGDPARSEQIAAYLENPVHLVTNREFNLWNGTIDGERVSVCSTGIGGPSTAIAAEELVACGADTLIRVGTCGGIALPSAPGDLVIASGAVRQDGTSKGIRPAEFPAVADTDVLFALRGAARSLGLRAPLRRGAKQGLLLRDSIRPQAWQLPVNCVKNGKHGKRSACFAVKWKLQRSLRSQQPVTSAREPFST